MSYETFQVRALYDFDGQDDTELSFRANEILTISSTNAGGEGWWYATNSAGRTGAVPETYLEKIEGQSSAAPEMHPFPQLDLQIDGHAGSALVPEPIPDSLDPFAPEPVPVHQETASFTAPTDPILGSDFNQNYDPNYLVVADVGHGYEPPSMTVFDPQPSDYPPSWDYMDSTRASASNENNAWYSTTNLDDSAHGDSFTMPTNNSNSGSLIDPMNDWSIPVVTQPKPVEVPPPAPTPTPIPKTENPAPASPQPTPKGNSTSRFGFGTLGRKSKPGLDKDRRKTSDVATEVLNQNAPKHDSNSDEFSDSGTHTLSPSDKPNENKPAAKARFFDKHGLDNYILHGSKLKFEEHAEISYDESRGGVYWVPSPTVPPFTCRIEDPQKGKKLGGLKEYMEYKIHTTFAGNCVVNRRYKHFDWLHEQLVNKYRFICIPQLPGKQIAGRFEQDFVEERRRQLEIWLNRICHHPVLCASFPVQHFVKCELTDKTNKDWKTGKRKVEKEESRDAVWLHCVTLTKAHPTELEIAKSIESFAQQQPALETHLRNLSQGLSKFLERHTEIYEKDMQKIGELFSKLHTAMEVDVTTPGNQEIAQSIARISASYNAIAQLYKTKASDGIRFFNEHLLEYIGLLACFPAIFTIYRSSTEFIRTVQQRGPSATADYAGAIQRNTIFNHVVLAEINQFQRDKVHDLQAYLKTVISEQIQFYEKVTEELRQALSTFH